MRRVLIILAFTLVATGCSFLKPYRVDIDQGNIVTIEKLKLVSLGMTQQQVNYLLGTPILVTPMTPDIKTYYYQNKPTSVGGVAQLVTLTFENGSLIKIEGVPYLQDADLL